MQPLFDLKDHIAKYGIWYESKVLIPKIHYRLVEDIDNIAHSAGLVPYYLTRSMSELCTKEEIDWAKKSKSLVKAKNPIYGLCYTSLHFNEERMFLMAAAFLRNYISVKIMTVQDLIEVCRSGEAPPETVLFIPNFYLSNDSGGSIPAWQVSMLLGVLYSRISMGHLTVLYCESFPGLTTSYGSRFSELLTRKFMVIE